MVVMVKAGATTVRLKLAVAVLAVGVAESVTVTAMVAVPVAVGVPLSTPVVALRVRPAGTPVALQMRGEVPPAAASV